MMKVPNAYKVSPFEQLEDECKIVRLHHGIASPVTSILKHLNTYT